MFFDMTEEDKLRFREIKSFIPFCNGIIEISLSLDLCDFEAKFRKCFLELQNDYKDIFPKSKDYSDQHIGEHIFTVEINAKQSEAWAKYQYAALLRSLERCFNDLKSKWSQNGLDNEAIGDIRVILEICVEAVHLSDLAYYFCKGQERNSGIMKRNILSSVEAYDASMVLLRKYIKFKHRSESAIPPTAIFCIRLALELRYKKILGIFDIKDVRGKSLRIGSGLYFQIARKYRKSIQCPVKQSIVEKIYDWSNPFIHAGLMPFTWQVEWAHYLLKPLFSWAKTKSGISIFGAVKIDKALYDNIEEIIAKELRLSQIRNPIKKYAYRLFPLLFNRIFNIQIERMPNPEAEIIQ